MSAPALAIAGIDHVVLRVDDVPRSLAFYEGVLGCKLERHQDDIGLRQLRAGAALIDLVNAGAGVPTIKNRNVDHIALAVRPFDEGALRAHLAAHDIAVEGGAAGNYGAEGDSPALYIRDPDGNMIELMGPGITKGDTAMTPNEPPLHTPDVAWIRIREGLSFRPLHFAQDGYALQLRLEPGTVIARHRHTGDVHALNVSGWRELTDTGERAGPGTYVYEPPGNNDTWRCLGDEPCVIHITVTGRVEYLDDAGNVTTYTDSHTAHALYLKWCETNGQVPRLAMNAARNTDL